MGLTEQRTWLKGASVNWKIGQKKPSKLKHTEKKRIGIYKMA